MFMIKMFLKKRPTISLLLIFTFVHVLLSTTTSTATTSENLPSRVPHPRRLKEIIKHDIARYKRMTKRAKWSPIIRRKAEEEEEAEQREDPIKSIIEGSVRLPLYGAADYEMGQYLVDMDVGTPPTKLRLVVDTGSDLTWVKCKNIPKGRFSDERGYEAGLSSTFHPLPCDTPLCKDEFKSLMSLDVCPTPTAPCLYNYTYGDEDGLETYGMFGKEIATLPTTKGQTVTLPNFLLGCSESYSGKVNLKDADGILGLGVHPFSFSILAANKFGGTFSYCLVDHLSQANFTSYLIFGDNKEKAPTAEYIRYTALRVTEASPYLWVNVKGITLSHHMLDIPPIVWREEEIGGTILDSGTAITYWTEQAYRAIMDVLVPALEKNYPKLPDCNGDGRVDFEYCFNSTSTPLDKSKVPDIEIHFTDGARFKPHVKSYIIDDGPDVKCVGFLEAPGGMNIIGNIMQQNYLWEFDMHHGSVGFYPSTCS